VTGSCPSGDHLPLQGQKGQYCSQTCKQEPSARTSADILPFSSFLEAKCGEPARLRLLAGWGISMEAAEVSGQAVPGGSLAPHSGGQHQPECMKRSGKGDRVSILRPSHHLPGSRVILTWQRGSGWHRARSCQFSGKVMRGNSLQPSQGRV